MRRGIIQLSTPDEPRGRATSANMIVVPSGPRLGQLESGIVTRFGSPTLSVVSGGAGASLAAPAIGLAVPAIRAYEPGRVHRPL